MPAFLKIAHRGASGYYRENTMQAFHKALELGANAIELDARETLDGDIVIHHDPSVRGIYEKKYLLRERTTLGLRGIVKPTGLRIPSLEYILSQFGNTTIINIELKVTGIVDKTLALIRQYANPERIIVSAFNYDECMPGDSPNWDDLFAMKHAEPRLKIALLTEKPKTMAQALDPLHSFMVFAVNPLVEETTPEFIEQAHALGVKVMPYVANDPRIIARLKAMGVDGIFSDYPDRL